MRIMLVWPYIVPQYLEEAEFAVWELSNGLARRGHRVEIFTTSSGPPVDSGMGYLIWNNYLPWGRGEKEGLVMRRFPVSHSYTAKARREARRLRVRLAKEESNPHAVSRLTGILRDGQACLFRGWYGEEKWLDGPARWTGKSALAAVACEDTSYLKLRILSPLSQKVTLSVDGEVSHAFNFREGEEKEIVVEFPPRGRFVLGVEAETLFKPKHDERNLGVAVRRLACGSDGAEHELGLDLDLRGLLEEAPEKPLAEMLWERAEAQGRNFSHMQDRLMGPHSPRLEEAVYKEAAGFDVIIGGRLPASTLWLAACAAEKSGRPFVAMPCFLSRDLSHYRFSALQALLRAHLVVTESPILADIMGARGKDVYTMWAGCAPVEREETIGPNFKERYRLGEGSILLWTGARAEGAGLRRAAEILRILREKGLDVELVVVSRGGEEKPAAGPHIRFLGKLPPGELEEIYAQCDALLLPDADLSFGTSVCRAWSWGKPVLVWRGCGVSSKLVEGGRDGFVCADAMEFALSAEMLLKNERLAERMGERGRDKVRQRMDWERILDDFESALSALL